MHVTKGISDTKVITQTSGGVGYFRSGDQDRHLMDDDGDKNIKAVLQCPTTQVTKPKASLARNYSLKI